MKYMNRDMEEKRIVAHDCPPLEPRCQGVGALALPAATAVLPRETIAVNNRGATNPFSSMSRFSLLQIDEEVEEPEKSENPTQSFKIHNIVWGRTQLLAIYRYVWMDGWME